ncbi:hypothetical protein ONJ87_27395, partial [Salmonella enterica subsp. enterica serovar Anatum]|nr:hypothetical protein [Salmonella enterica subsp. enterica serovar Anatum]
ERNVAVRMTNLSTGEYYSRFWKERQLTADSWFQDDKYIYIPAMIVNGFCKDVFSELPLEFAVEAQKLLAISLEHSVG